MDNVGKDTLCSNKQISSVAMVADNVVKWHLLRLCHSDVMARSYGYKSDTFGTHHVHMTMLTYKNCDSRNWVHFEHFQLEYILGFELVTIIIDI